MSKISFQKGEILSADKLNQLASIVDGVVARGGGSGSIPPPSHLATPQRFTKYAPAGIPVMADKTTAFDYPSGTWARMGCSPSFSQVSDFSPAQPVYLIQRTHSDGTFKCAELSATRPDPVDFDPIEDREGIYPSYHGRFIEDSAQAGTTAAVSKFFENPLYPAIPQRAFSLNAGPTSLPPISGLSDIFHIRVPLVVDKVNSPQALYFRGLESTGGLAFVLPPSTADPIKIVPRFEIAAAPSTEAPISEPQNQPWAPKIGEWVTVASNNIAGSNVELKMQWVTPWKAYMLLDVGESIERKPIDWIWKKAWGIPGVDTPPVPITIRPAGWSLVSYSRPCTLYVPDGMAVFEEVIAEALADAPSTWVCNIEYPGEAYRLRAFLRRDLSPCNQPTCWCIWWDKCYTFLPWINS